jgi:ketosteroid isomerase-like protein
MKTILSLLLLSLLASPLFAQSSEPAPHPLTGFQKMIGAMDRNLRQAMDSGDLDAVRSAVADDFVGISSNGDTDGKSDLLEGARFAKMAKPPKEDQKPILYFFSVVPLNESAAVITYDEVRPGDYPRYLHVSHTWVKEGDAWKLKFEQATPNLWSATDLD